MNSVTRYQWDTKWEKPIRIEAPGAAATTLADDPANGNTLWQQQGGDTTRFTYHTSGAAAGQLATVTAPPDGTGWRAVERLEYDALGNLRKTVNALGHLSLVYRDALGRDTLTVTPIHTASAADSAALRNGAGARVRTGYDEMDRVRWTQSIGPRLEHPGRGTLGSVTTEAEVLDVSTQYDREGRPLWVERTPTPDSAMIGTLVTEYEYDRAGRRIRETDAAQTQRFAYDAAGNQTDWTNGRGHTTSTRYDAAGRLTLRIVPQMTYAAWCEPSGGGDGGGDPPPGDWVEPTGGTGDLDVSATSTGSCAAPFPFYPNGAGGSLVIPAEWTFFRYDAAGRMVHAENADAVVGRDYYPNGALRYDRLHIMGYERVGAPGHQYALEYGYDAAGRATSLRHPQSLAGSASLDVWSYDAVTGALSSAVDRSGNAFTFRYDRLRRPTSVWGPGNSYVDSTTYDRGGRRAGREARTAGETLFDEAFTYDARGKLLTTVVETTSEAGTGGSTYHQWYSGLGNLAATDWASQYDPAVAVEQFRSDALGNVYSRRSSDTHNWTYSTPFLTRYAFGGRVDVVKRAVPTSSFEEAYTDSTTRTYDASGNVDWGLHIYGSTDVYGNFVVTRHSRTRSYYGADDRLRYHQERTLNSGTSVEELGGWEEYRYDPLGRRVMVRRNAEGLCNQPDQVQCASHVTRFVWSGDNLLWELKAEGGNTANIEAESSSGVLYGRVSYFHAGGIDRPLVITKAGRPSVIPHQNWRGQFVLGTYATGALADCAGGETTGCESIPWPGHRTTAWHRESKAPDIRTWYGGLVDGMRDASGQMYMRNRYYDPATGQFTQPDPIGLAGGLNSYGFAAGDPVTYRDPYGLRADCDSAKEKQEGRLCPIVVQSARPPLLTRFRNWWNRTVPRPLRGPIENFPDILDPPTHGDKFVPPITPPGVEAPDPSPAPPAGSGPPRGRIRGADGEIIDIEFPEAGPDTEDVVKAAGAGAVIYWIISTATRAYPPRNLIPVP